MLQVYLAGQKFDGVMLCFDLNNLVTLESLGRYFLIIESMVNQVPIEKTDEVIEQIIDKRQVPSATTEQATKIPIMIVGCKLDLIDKFRAQYLLINSKVLKSLKSLDPD